MKPDHKTFEELLDQIRREGTYQMIYSEQFCGWEVRPHPLLLEASGRPEVSKWQVLGALAAGEYILRAAASNIRVYLPWKDARGCSHCKKYMSNAIPRQHIRNNKTSNSRMPDIQQEYVQSLT